MTDLTERNRTIWSAGNWDGIADYVSAVGPRLLDRAGLDPGMHVLDVGTGSGSNVAIPAAQLGAQVTGLDVTDAWFDAGRRRAETAGVHVDWVVGDAMDMPLDDGAFDRVLSTFGHMFAADHARTTAELVRVCAPGGVIAFATWRATGFPGETFRTIAKHMPPPPDGVQPPPAWGEPDYIRGLFAAHDLVPEFEERSVSFPAASAEELHTAFIRDFGPLVMARAALGDRFAALEEDMRAAVERTFEADGARGDYLVTVVRT